MDNNPNPQDDKPVEPIVETPVEEKVPDYSYDELHKETTEEIATNDKFPEDKPVEDKPEVKPEVVPEDKPVIDPAKLAEDVAAKVTENLKPAVVEEKKEEVKDAYELFFDKTKAEKGREPNWAEVSKFIQEQTLESIKQEREVEAKAEQERKAIEEKATAELTTRFNATLDEELEEMYKKGELTPIKDKDNPSDQGVIERRSLFQKMLDVNTQRASEGKPAIMSLMRIRYGYWEKPNAQPAGEDAPISMGKGSPAGDEDEQELDYQKDVHGKSWSGFHLPKLGK